MEASFRDMVGGYDNNVQDGPTADMQDRVLQRIRREPGGVIKRRDLFASKRKGFKDIKDFESLMKLLAEAGQIEVLKETRSGNEVISYKLIG